MQGWVFTTFWQILTFGSSDPGIHWAGSRLAAKNRAESLGAVAPQGRPCWGPEPPPVPHHPADASLSSPAMGEERASPFKKDHSIPCLGEADCPPPPPYSLPAPAEPYSCRNNQNTCFIWYRISFPLFKWKQMCWLSVLDLEASDQSTWEKSHQTDAFHDLTYKEVF